MKRTSTCSVFIVTMAAILAGCGGDNIEVVDTGLVIRNATIVNTDDGSLVAGSTIVVSAGKIALITQRFIGTSGSAQAIDASGKFVVPGFLDMHAHVMEPTSEQSANWALLLANGVTGVREMSGSDELVANVRRLNADRAAGKVDAPEILQVHGGFFAGAPTTEAAGRQFVQERKTAGADYIRLIAGAPPFVLGVLDESKKAGLGVAGHLPTAVSALTASNAGWRAIEHLGAGWGLLLDCAANETSIRQAALTSGFAPPFPAAYTVNPRLYDIATNAPFYRGILDTFNDAKCQTLAQAFVTNQTWQVPTLIRLRTQNFSTSQEYRADPNLQYVDRARRVQWEQMAKEFGNTGVVPEAAAKTLRDFYALELQVTRQLKQRGVKMLAGSDSAPIAIWTIPGFSLHQEFRELSAAGLTPLEILQMTTRNGAEFLGRTSTMGSVDAGKNADLVLLDGDPTKDVANLSRISAVVLRGKHFSKAALDKLKADVAVGYATQPLAAAKASLKIAVALHVH